MAIPTYQTITDAELLSKKPVTSSLLRRLRDNAMAVMGIDNTVDNPVFTLPPSRLEVYGVPVSTTFISNYFYVNTMSAIVSRMSGVSEILDVSFSSVHQFDGANHPAILFGTRTYLFDVRVPYSSGVPNGVVLRIFNSSAYPVGYPNGAAGYVDAFIPLDGSRIEVVWTHDTVGDDGKVWASASVTGDEVWLSLTTGTSTGVDGQAILTLKTWRNKFAP